MAQFAYRTYTVFTLEGKCPECAENQALELKGGTATFGDVSIAIRSVVEAEPARFEGGEIEWCEEHANERQLNRDGTPKDEANDADDEESPGSS